MLLFGSLATVQGTDFISGFIKLVLHHYKAYWAEQPWWGDGLGDGFILVRSSFWLGNGSWSRVLVAFTENLSSVPRGYFRQLIIACNFRTMGVRYLF